MTYCPHCGNTLPPHTHRRAFRFRRQHLVIMLVPLAHASDITLEVGEALALEERAA